MTEQPDSLHGCWIVASDRTTAAGIYRRYVEASDSQALYMLEQQTVLRTRREALDKVASLPGLKKWHAYHSDELTEEKH